MGGGFSKDRAWHLVGPLPLLLDVSFGKHLGSTDWEPVPHTGPTAPSLFCP